MHGSRQPRPGHPTGATARFSTALLALTLLVCGAPFAAPSGAAQSDRVGAFVVTQLPVTADTDPLPSGMLPVAWGDGARIVLVTAEGRVRKLTGKFHSAADPDVSFDGERMLFAGRRTARDAWNIFEMNLDGSGVRQVTRDAGNCRRPVYEGTLNTLDATEPWRHIAFVSDLAQELNEQGATTSTSLYSCNLDGSAMHRLTMNPSSDLDPTVLPDGRLLFASWQRSTLERGLRGRVSLFAAQSDGIDYALISGDEGLRVKLMPTVTTDRLVVFVEADRVPWDGAGRLASVKLSRNLHSHRIQTDEPDGLFHSPSPLADGRLLVSRRPVDGSGDHAVVRYDPRSGAVDAVFDDPKRHDLQARSIAPRPLPDGRSTVVSEGYSTGLLYGLDVYLNDLKDVGGLPPGSAKRLRVLEGVPRLATAHAAEPSAARDDVAPPLLQRRILGEAPIHPDGSFNVEIPANVPVALQMLDEQGVALRTCGWIWVRNRESRGCIGCHEDGELTPPNRLVDAVREESVRLDPPPGERRTVDFRRDVMPVLTGTCASARCHLSGGAAPTFESTGDPRRLYETLLAPGSNPADPSRGRYVHPGRARTSPLIRHIHEVDTARPWDGDSIHGGFPPMPSHGSTLIDDEARRTLIEWIDLGAAWDGIPPAAAPAAAHAADNDNDNDTNDANRGTE